MTTPVKLNNTVKSVAYNLTEEYSKVNSLQLNSIVNSVAYSTCKQISKVSSLQLNSKRAA